MRAVFENCVHPLFLDIPPLSCHVVLEFWIPHKQWVCLQLAKPNGVESLKVVGHFEIDWIKKNCFVWGLRA